ncbi:hypothetical protein KCU81_g4523, partial [Aureobasidium melanogenum]|uniref:BTB domain-containing protein n=1 Tax=Aureobasidium melanogenum (strain CBS 110374) TaxID=1043003 RepID=A0A074WD69_AURM1
MTTSCSYNTTSLFSLRPQAIRPLLHRCASAERLNLWVPSAQQNERGHTQPFPFEHYIQGIGTIITSANHINEIFADMSSDTPSGDPWAIVEPSSVEQDITPPTIADAAEAVVAEQPTEGATSETPADALSTPVTEVRKSSLADLANGDLHVVKAHLAERLGPHRLLSRFSSTSQKSDTELNGATAVTNSIAPNTNVFEPDGAASIVDDSTSVASTNVVATKDESTQTAPDTDASKLFRATPASSVTDGDKSLVHSPDISPRAVRKAPPHHRLKTLTLAQDVSPDPAAKSSTSDEGPATPVATAIELEPVIIQNTPPAPPAIKDDDNNESDTSSVIMTEFPSSLSNKEKNLDPKAEAWVPDDTVGPLPPSRPESPLSVSRDSEAFFINECCPVPGDWSVPTKIGSFAKGILFDGLMVGNVYKTVLAHYSHYFATAFASGKEEELDRVLKNFSFDVFRQWIFGRNELPVKSSDDLKVLVQLWRFAARIQAPLFANTVANAIVKKAITADDIIDAGDEIDALLQMVSVNNTFRLLISHVVILRDIQPDEKWPKSLILSVLNCWEMGKNTYDDIQRCSQTPCIYHLHSSDHTCMSE